MGNPKNENNLAGQTTSISPSKENKPLKPTQDSTKPVKATDRMAPNFTGYAEGRRPNTGGRDGKN